MNTEDFNLWNSYKCPVCGHIWAEPADTEDKTSSCQCGRSEETMPYHSAPLVVTTRRFWDCECKTNYIRLASENGCGICLSVAEEMPDSHVREVDTGDLQAAVLELTEDLRVITDELARRG